MATKTNEDKISDLEGNIIRVTQNLVHIKESVDNIGKSIADMSKILGDLANLQTKQFYLEDELSELRKNVSNHNETFDKLNTDHQVFKTKIMTGVSIFVVIISIVQAIVGYTIKDKFEKLNELDNQQNILSERVIFLETLQKSHPEPDSIKAREILETVRQQSRHK